MPILRIGSFGGRRNLPTSPALRRAPASDRRRCRRLRPARRRPARSAGARARHQAERHQQRAEQHRVGSVARRRFELAPIGVERREAVPQRLVLRAALHLRRDRLEQAMLGQRAERLLRMRRSAGSCSTPRSAAPATPCAIRPRCVAMASTTGAIEAEVRGATPSRSRAACAPGLPGSARWDRRCSGSARPSGPAGRRRSR